MNDTPSTPTPPMMNDDAARSLTGEILDQATPPTEKPTDSGTTPPTSETKQPDQSTTSEKKPDTPAAPDAYTDFTAPEGYTLAKETIDAALPIFKELGLSQEQAQKLVSFHAEQMIAAAKAPQATYETLRSDWQAKIKSDADMTKAVSGDKTGLDAVKLDIGRAYAALPPDLATEMKAAMDLTGAGDHPAIVKGFWKLAQFVTEGKAVTGKGPSPLGQREPGKAPPSAAQALYPNLPSSR